MKNNLFIYLCLSFSIIFSPLNFCIPINIPDDSTLNVSLWKVKPLSTNLKLIGVFPSEDSGRIILSQPWSIATDNSNHIALLDMREGKVFIFNKEMKLLLSFGQKGQGPGEFVNPTKVGFYQNTIYVFDPSAHRVSFFNLDGNFIESTRLFNQYSDIAISDDRKIYACRRIRGDDESMLVDLLDIKGTLISSFGKPFKYENILTGFSNQNKIAILPDKKVIIGSLTTADLAIFTPDGTLLKKPDSLKLYKNKSVTENIKRLKSRSQGNSSIGYAHLFENMKICDTKVFFLSNTRDGYEIIEMNSDLALAKTYVFTYPKPIGTLGIDFLPLIKENNDIIFHIVELQPDINRVIILTKEGEKK